jgi:hypothetical protein
VSRLSDSTLIGLEEKYEGGISSADLLAELEAHDVRFSEATLRKYVQLGLLPRSVRVGRKGKHKGSQGLYPASVIRTILQIREMMAQDYTIEEIQREFMFVRGDIEQLERTLDSIFESLKKAVEPRRDEPAGRAVSNDVSTAESLAKDLLARLQVIEQRLLAQSRVARRAMGE